MCQRFEGKAALITGGSSGIGLAIVKRLTREGASTVIVAQRADKEDLSRVVADLTEAGCDAEGVVGDVADETTATEAVERMLARFGRIDVLINNAGFGFTEPVLDAPMDHIDRVHAVNVRGTFMMTVKAAKAMLTTGGGVVVNTASTSSFMGEEFQLSYNASKAAVAALTRSFAVDLAPHGIRVNAVAPGWVATRGTARVTGDVAEWAKHRSHIPADRPARPEEIAAVHAFLASDDASYMTGAIVTCDGGQTAGFRSSGWAAVN